LVSAESIRGKKVIGAKGALIGQIDNIDIDTQTWRATHVRISLTEDAAKQLGFRTGLISSRVNKPIISLPIESIDQVGDVVTIKSSIKEISDLEMAKPSPA